MRVFIAGSTGVLGRRVVAECVDRGHEVIGLTRDAAGDQVVRERGGDPHRGDVLEPETLYEAAEGADVIVHAATKIPTGTDLSEEAWAQNDRIRRAGTEHLLDAAAEVGARRFVMQSIVWVARQPDGSWFDESAEPHPDQATQSAIDAEQVVTEAADEIEPVVLRGGWFYAPDSAHTRLFGRQLLAGDLPVIGGGLLGRRDARLSFVHVDDAGRAFAMAATGEETGTFHVVDDEPRPYADFLRTLARELDAPEPSRYPAWLARFFADDGLIRMLTSPMPTGNERCQAAFGWAPEYSTIEEGIAQVVERWRDSGTVIDRGAGPRWTGA